MQFALFVRRLAPVAALAAVLAALVGVCASAAQPAGQSAAPGVALSEALDRHVTSTWGTRNWPGEGPRGISPEEYALGVRNGDTITITGQISGPNGFSGPVNWTTTIVGGGYMRPLGSGARVELRVAATSAGRINLAVGVWAAGQARVASRAGIASGSDLSIPLGEGYTAELVITQRAPTEQERIRNAGLADSLDRLALEDAARRAGTGAPGQAAPLPPVSYSPLTNSVIRQGGDR